MSTAPCIIVGASHGAVQMITSLRQEGWSREIILIGAEKLLPYHRPPLSKALLTGKTQIEKIFLRPEKFYEQQGVTLKLGQVVKSIDRSANAVILQNGEILHYSNLVIATGAVPIILNLPGEELEGIGYLRTYEDVRKLVPFIKEGKKAVVVGGGYIGLETAAALREAGMDVTVLEGLNRVLQRVTGEPVSDFYTRAHAKRGVKVITNAVVTGFSGNGHVREVLCGDGSTHPADLVMIGVGIRPNTALAEKAGLEIDNGIAVNKFSQTSDPHIYAMGDCASFPSLHTGTRLRLESVPNASEQAKTAAAKICGKEKPYTALPWFWSDQFDIKLQIAGVSMGFDDIVIRGDIEEEKLSVWYFRGDQLLAADCINMPHDFMAARKILSQKLPITKAQVADPACKLV